MGYTHYWSHKEDFSPSEWQTIRLKTRALLHYTKAAIRLEFDSHLAALVDEHEIIFNGVGDDGHETFHVTRLRRSLMSHEQEINGARFGFCKTACKPYDEVVLAILMYMSDRFPRKFEISSDGDIGKTDGDKARALLEATR